MSLNLIMRDMDDLPKTLAFVLSSESSLADSCIR